MSQQQFTWSDFLKLSNNSLEEVHDNPQDILSKAKLRTIVSRTYYACYHKALKLLEKKQRFTLVKNKSPHQQVIAAMFYLDASVADELDRLRNNRVDADYHADVPFNLNKVGSIVKHGMKLHHELREIYHK